MLLPKETSFKSREEAHTFLSGTGAKAIMGVDEVGRGALCGDVVAAAVVLHPDHSIEGIRDSKKLSSKRRAALAEQIMERSWWTVGVMDSASIDDVNIREATLDAAAHAVFKHCLASDSRSFDIVLCDGGLHLRSRLAHLNLEHVPTMAVIKGDQWFESIGAASIVAKVFRDKQMSAYHDIWPEYGFNTNAGYGTKFHVSAINSYGLLPIHRRSFGPCVGVEERLVL